MNRQIYTNMNGIKIGIVGDDMTAFHLFNKIYRSDDRYEVVCFFPIEPTDNNIVVFNKFPADEYQLPSENKYPPVLAGELYPEGIKIFNAYPYNPISIMDMNLDKCIFSPLCIASGKYLHLAAQFMAHDCSIISHSLDVTCLPPPKAFVSFFSDTQFDIPILMKILQTYVDQGNKPVIAMAGPLGPNYNQRFKFGKKCEPYVLVQDIGIFRSKYEHYFTGHKLETCEALLSKKFKIYFIYDFELFSSEALRNDLYDMIVFVGFNSLPCFYESHLLVYACDDFTFGDDISEHPSSIICQQAHVIIYVHLKSDESSQKITEFTEKKEPKIVCLPVTMKTNNQGSCLRPSKVALLVDDSYPTHHCHATYSISKYIAESFSMIPYTLKEQRVLSTAECPVYGDQTKRNWPAIIFPETPDGIAKCFKEKFSQTDIYDVVISSTSKPCTFKPPNSAPVVQFKFDVATNNLVADLFSLPVGAFAKKRKR